MYICMHKCSFHSFQGVYNMLEHRLQHQCMPEQTSLSFLWNAFLHSSDSRSGVWVRGADLCFPCALEPLFHSFSLYLYLSCTLSINIYIYIPIFIKRRIVCVYHYFIHARRRSTARFLRNEGKGANTSFQRDCDYRHSQYTYIYIYIYIYKASTASTVAISVGKKEKRWYSRLATACACQRITGHVFIKNIPQLRRIAD